METTRIRRAWLLSLGVTLCIWAWCSWPLPLRVHDTIPAAYRPEGIIEREMIPGDHLQFLYNLWLARDMLFGPTPIFHNLYEFNVGDDAARRKPGPWYAPFAVLYAAGETLGGRAFGYNFAGLLSLWITVAASWALCRRWTRSPWTALAGAAVSIAIPYRWVTLLGGSPTGLAMAFPPLLLLGLDRAVRDRSIVGGLLAGLAILGAWSTDTHALFFSVLIVPPWCVALWLSTHGLRLPPWRITAWTAGALAPVAACTLLAWLLSAGVRDKIDTAELQGGRPTGEVAAFSPRPEGLWRPANPVAPDNHVYLGAVLVALLAAGAATRMHAATRSAPHARRALWLDAAILLGAAGMVCLALGPFGPYEGRGFTAARRFLPPYRMIRQPDKIFLLLPTLLALGAARSLDVILPLLRPRAARALGLSVVLAIVCECGGQVGPTLCRLVNRQGAYEAVARDAAAAGQIPRLLVAPLWKGDTHISSVYEHFASLYRIRMLNGYSPIVSQAYLDGAFNRFESINRGELTDDQIDDLLARGIRHVIAHDSLFLERISPFPAVFSLRNLLEHPRIEWIARDETVWAFRLLDRPAPAHTPPAAQTWNSFFPTRRWEAERAAWPGGAPVPDPTCGGRAYVQLAAGASNVTRRVDACNAPGMRWMLRARGAATGSIETMQESQSVGIEPISLSSAEWTWIESPVPMPLNASRELHAVVRVETGALDFDMALLAAGEWSPPAPGEALELPAPLFFHAGGIVPEENAVHMRAAAEPEGVAFHGPYLPLPVGRYRVTMEFDSPAAAGTLLARWTLWWFDGRETPVQMLVAGEPATLEFDAHANLPFRLTLVFARRGDLTLRTVRLEGLEP